MGLGANTDDWPTSHSALSPHHPLFKAEFPLPIPENCCSFLISLIKTAGSLIRQHILVGAPGLNK